MNIEVSKDNVVILNKTETPHENEYNITECNFTFDEFTDSFQVKRAIFTILSTGEMYEIDIVNNKCFTPPEVLKHEYETVKLGVYGYNIEIVDEKETLKERFSPSYDTFVVPTGSYEEGALSPEIITPSQYDIYSQALQEGLDDVADALEEVSHVDIDANKSDRTTTVTITNRHNEEKTVEILDGEDGYTPVKGVDYFTTSEIEEIENTVKTDVINELDFDNTINDIKQDIQDLNTNKASKTELEQEKSARELSDTNLQSQIDAITSSKDVVDIVGTYGDLQNYDTSTLTEDDVIKVLDDSTHNDAMSYYRWSNNTWVYVGSEGPFYTRSETDERLNTKQATIDSSHKLASDLVDDTNQTHKFTNDNEKNTWNAKYDKPSNGIPKSDLVESVQESLDKADSSIQPNDYATSTTGGVVRDGTTSLGYNVTQSGANSGRLEAQIKTYQQYQNNLYTNGFIGKGTLENVITGKQLVNQPTLNESQDLQDTEIDKLKMIYNILPTDTDTGETISIDNTGEMPINNISLGGNTTQEVIPAESGTNVNATSISISDVNTSKEHTIGIDGNTYQETTTGKNLLTSGSQYNDTASGITGSYNDETGEFTISGTASTTGNTQITSTQVPLVLSSGTTLTFSSTETMPRQIYIHAHKTSGGYQNLSISANTKYGTYTLEDDIDYYNLRFNVENETTYNFTTKFQLETGSTQTDWEKFTYGVSPNPGYSQPIEVVTGENDIIIEGKNLFDKDGTNFDGHTGINNFNGKQIASNSFIGASCYNLASNNARCQVYFKGIAGQTYYLSLNSNYTMTAIKAFTSDGIIKNEFALQNQITMTTDYMGISLRKSDSTDFTDEEVLELKNSIQIEQGSTATTYEPYVSQTYPINLGNMADKGYVTGYVDFDGTIGSSTNWLTCADYIAVEPNTNYTFKAESTGTRCLIGEYNSDKTFIASRQEIVIGNTYTTRSTTRYIKFSVPNDSINILVYKTSTPPIELCKIGTYKDRIYKQNDKWYLEQNINKDIFDGSNDEIWNYESSTTTPTNRTVFAIYYGPNVIANNYYSNRFIYQSETSNRIVLVADSNRLYLSIDNQIADINTSDTNNEKLNKFINWLTNNNVILYKIKNATTIEITDSTLVSQLNALANSTLYSTTNINTTTSNLLPYIDLQYNVVTPAPSPNRPSVVNVVKGNNTLTISNSDNTESQNYPINLGDMELCKIGTYQDYIYESNGNWFKKGNIGKVVLNGSEGWIRNTSYLNAYYVDNFFTNILQNADRTMYCDKFSYGGKISSSSSVAVNKFYTWTALLNRLIVGTDLFTSADDFKYWLSQNNSIIYFPLETPTDTQITDTTLITQLDNLQKAISYDTQTNISQTNEDKPFIITAEMFLSLKNVFE